MELKIGIDFDNTIVDYNNVFYKYALIKGLISPEIKKNKKEIRDNIRLFKGSDFWTELQGLVYSKYMNEADLAEGLEDFLAKCKENSINFLIISHKTLYPVIGPPINLHQVAMKWLKDRDFFVKYGLSKSEVVFKETLEEKLNTIAKLNCTHFIDDMLEVLTHRNFPSNVKKVLYSSEEMINSSFDIKQFSRWNEIEKYFFEK